MPNEPFRYPDLMGRLRSEGLVRVFTHGRGGPLAFLLVLGTGVLAIPLAAPLLAVGYAAACALLLVPIIRGAMTDPTAQREVLAGEIAERFPTSDLEAPAHRAAIERSAGILTEIAVRIHDAERGGRTASGARAAFADAAGLVDLQRESALQAESLERVLAIVERNDEGGGASHRRKTAGDAGRTSAGSSAAATATELRQRNIDAVRSEARAADELIVTIGHRLETILLQTSQIDRETIDMVRADEAVRGSEEAVERLQDVVESRRRAADRLISVLSTESDVGAADRPDA
jgi:ribosomal protein L25 (general stress protein Ctc)